MNIQVASILLWFGTHGRPIWANFFNICCIAALNASWNRKLISAIVQEDKWHCLYRFCWFFFIISQAICYCSSSSCDQLTLWSMNLNAVWYPIFDWYELIKCMSVDEYICQTRFEFLSQFRKVRNAFECFVTQVQTRLPKTKCIWPMKINVICTVLLAVQPAQRIYLICGVNIFLLYWIPQPLIVGTVKLLVY